jgi:guanine deaminase
MADERYAGETDRLFLRSLASHGTTTALVFGAHFGPATTMLFEQALASGLRIASGLVVSDRGLRPDLHVPPATAYAESTALIDRYHRRDRLLYAVTPRFAVSTSEAMLEVCQQLLRDHPDVRLQTHINENPAEVAEVSRLFPWAGDYLAVYERYGLSGPRSVMAHNVHATPSQLARLAVAKTAIAHCPSSNVALASGRFSMSQHVAAGIRCALGTDVGGGLGFSMMKESLHAYLMQRLSADPQPLDAARLLFLATRAGAEALGLEDETGDFQIGKSSDFVYLRPPAGSILDITVRHALEPAHALESLFTLAGAETIREVRVAGDVVFPIRDEAA